MKDIPSKELKLLLRQIARGSDQAVERVFSHYQSFLFVFIRLRIRDDEAAEEILNDTFMIAFQKASQFNETSEYKTWLCGIAKNVCGTWMRKHQSSVLSSTVEVEDEVFENLPDPGWGILEKLESDELNEVLRECVDQLPEGHRETLFWSLYEEEPMELVAQRLECPVGTVKSRLFTARKKVADCVRAVFSSGVGYV